MGSVLHLKTKLQTLPSALLRGQAVIDEEPDGEGRGARSAP